MATNTERTNDNSGTTAPEGVDGIAAPTPTPPRRRRRGLRHAGRGGALLAVAIVASLVSAVAVSAASGSFSDVPADHPFAEDIAAVSDSCIAAGYADGTYKPSADVTRQAMAAFINRTASKTFMGAKVGGTNPNFGQAATGKSPSVPVAEVVVEVPDLPGSCLVPVEVHGQLGVSLAGSMAVACTAPSCQLRGVLTKNGVDEPSSLLTDRVFETTHSSQFSVSNVFLQQDGTTATYAVAAQGFSVGVNGGTTSYERNIFAVIHPMNASN